MRRLVLVAALVSLAAAGDALAAAPCKDAKGKFIKCPPPVPAASAKPIRCKDGKGKFAKCGTPGAIPM